MGKVDWHGPALSYFLSTHVRVCAPKLMTAVLEDTDPQVQLCSSWKSWLCKRKIHDSLRNAVKRILQKQWRRPFYKLLKSFFSSAESWGNSRTEDVL